MNNTIILIVEDSPTQADMLRFLLEKWGYIVDHCLDGKQALKKIQEDRPDLVISDIIMPEMNGYELCKRIKDDSDLNSIPVLLLTSLEDSEDIIIGLECGADNYLMKPYDESLLIERVESIFRDGNHSGRNTSLPGYDIIIEGKKYKMKSSRERILDMMVSVYEATLQKTKKLQETQNELNRIKSSLKQLVQERTSDLSKKIGQRRSIEEFIKRSEQRYRKLVEHAILGVFQADENGIIIFANQALINLLGYVHTSDLHGKDLKMLFSQDHDFNFVMERLHGGNSIKNHEIVISGNNNQKINVILNMDNNDGQFSGFIIDNAIRKAAEEKERNYQNVLEITMETAKDSDREKSLFLSNMSHDVKNPLNAISGFSSLLADPDLDMEQKREYYTHIRQNTNILSTLINNILDLSRIEANRIHLEESNCLLNKLMDEIMDQIHINGTIFKGSKVTVELCKGNPNEDFSIFTDQERLKQVLLNLLDNALKYTEKGSVRFGYEVRKDELRFFVKDTGIGIQQKDKDRVLNRFQKAEHSNVKHHGGSGLGLTIANHLVQMMNGQLRIESQIGQGTEVSFNQVLNELSPPLRKLDTLTVKNVHSTLAGRQILVADDNEMNYMLIKAFLDESGIELTWARDGIDAVSYCKSEEGFDMVLMDLQMPNMDGFEATREIRKIRPGLPVIAVTAYSKSDVLEQANETGFNGFLKKPLAQKVIIDTIKSFLVKGDHASSVES